MDIVGQVRAEIAKLRMTHKEVSDALGISRAAFATRLNGHSDFRLREIECLARLAGISLVEFFARAETPSAEESVAVRGSDAV